LNRGRNKNIDPAADNKAATRGTPSIDKLLKGLKEGNTALLSRAITLIESTRPDDRETAHLLLEQCATSGKQTMRIGITGAPGAGKSTFIEALGTILAKMGKKVAVLAVDPTSSLSHGSILGDKTRMPGLAVNPLVYIRPTPSGGNLGGVARHTRESIMLCEAAGFEVILIETVGVGQSETAVHSMVDFFLLLLLPGSGDELQGIKRGIIEMADALVINKADGDNIQRALEARSACERAMHLYPPKENGWVPRVFSCSALENLGIEQIWAVIASYKEQYEASGYLKTRRKEQNKYWLMQAVDARLSDQFYTSGRVREILQGLMEKVEKGELSPFRAASMLLDAYRKGT
jgi:LAO/AO transport system kinase